MACAAVAVLGVVSFLRLPVDLLPDVAYPSLAVSTVYPGAGPEEVERFVTAPIEESLGRVAGVRRVTSRSREGESLVRLRFAWGTDMEFAALHARERLDELAGRLPRGSERPVLLETDPSDDPILTLAVTGGDLLQLRSLSEAVFKRRLEQLDGVALASVAGGPRREVRVVMDPDRLEARGLRLEDVTRALDASNYTAPGGVVRRGRYRYSLRTLGHFTAVEELRRVPVTASGSRARGGTGQGARAGTGGGSAAGAGGGATSDAVLLGRIAEVRDALAEPETLARWGGEPAVGLRIHKEAGANTVRVAEAVEATVDRLREEYPGVGLTVASSQADFVSAAISNVAQALLLGGLLAFVVLFAFLREPRYPVAVGVAIPLSVLAALALFHVAGVSLNVMSLGGLALGVGMLVDNSIVVLENIFRHRDEEGAGPREAASVGTREVAGAITASTLTTVAVFGPVLYVEGVAGALFADLSLAVAFSLLASLVVALTVLPVMAARTGAREVAGARTPGDGADGRRTDAPATGGLDSGAGAGTNRAGDPGRRPGAIGRLLETFDCAFRAFADRYERALAWSLAHRGAVLALAAGSLALAALVGAGLPRGLMPEVDEGRFRVDVRLPVGTPLETTDELTRRLEGLLLEADGVEGVYARVGRARGAERAAGEAAGLHTAALEVRLADDGPATREAVERFRAAVAKSGVDPGAVAVATGRSTSLGRALDPGGADLAVKVKGGELDELAAVAESARARLAGLERLADVRVDFERAQPRLEVEVLRDEVARHGLSVREVADAVEAFLRGLEAERPYTEFDDRIAIRVSLPDTVRRDLSDVLRTTVGGVPVERLVRVSRGFGPVEVRREGQTRTVEVLADVSRGLGRAVAAVRDRLEGLATPGLVRLEVGGENQEMRDSFRSLLFAFGLALFLVYLILSAQFESVVRPTVVLAAVPLAAVGAVLALWAAGAGIDVMSGIGVVILVGIVVNDAIIKVDFVEQRRRQGLGKRAALMEAGRLRLRPIVMTTVTTVLGLTPLALGWGAGADLRAPLAVAVIGGLLSATFLTLIVVPVIYSVVVDTSVPVDEP